MISGIIDKIKFSRRLTSTETQIAREVSVESAYNESFVKDVIVRYNDKLKERVCQGLTVGIGQMGMMSIVENKYRNVAAESGIHEGARKHRFRPKIKWVQAFTQEIGGMEDVLNGVVKAH